jgi:hypothetical protein
LKVDFLLALDDGSLAFAAIEFLYMPASRMVMPSVTVDSRARRVRFAPIECASPEMGAAKPVTQARSLLIRAISLASHGAGHYP